MNWIAEHSVTWLLPSGERMEGRIAIGAPEPDGEDWRCVYAIDGLPGARVGQVHGAHSLQALWHAMQYVGMWLYFAFVDGVRILPEEDDGDGPLAATAGLLAMLGPVIRAPLNPRGVADPEGKLAELEAEVEKQRRHWEEEFAKLPAAACSLKDRRAQDPEEEP